MKREPGKTKRKDDKERARQGDARLDKAGTEKASESGRRDAKPGKKQSLYSRLREELKTNF